MQNLSKAMCLRFREARRERGLGQVELSNRVGCKQPALSAFEAGNPTKLSEETVIKLAEILDISLKEPVAAEEDSLRAREIPVLVQGFCPEKECPSNVAYRVGERSFWRITLQSGRFCAHCGEVLEKACPSCGAPLNAGACCSQCGKPYLA